MMKVVMDGSSQEMVARFHLTYILFPHLHASSTPPVCGGPLGQVFMLPRPCTTPEARCKAHYTLYDIALYAFSCKEGTLSRYRHRTTTNKI